MATSCYPPPLHTGENCSWTSNNGAFCKTPTPCKLQQVYAHFERLCIDEPIPSFIIEHYNRRQRQSKQRTNNASDSCNDSFENDMKDVYESSDCPTASTCSSDSSLDDSSASLDQSESNNALSSFEDKLKDWIWNTYKDKIFENMSIKYESEPTELEMFKKRLDLLDKVAQVQRQYLQSEGPKVVYGHLLSGLLDLMQSEYGFIGECMIDEEDGSTYVDVHAASNIAWNEETQKFYEDNVAVGLKFYNLDTLFGRVITTAKPVISNDPKSDPRAKGTPPGHPTINSFLGIPFFKKDGEIIGMVGIANKPGGYSLDDVAFLEPFTVTCSNLIQAYWQIQNNKHLINTLEEKVLERTQTLELTNQRLELANKRVTQASAAQLQHFACMSHEIRTPLNCIIGLSSLLQDTQLNPMQKESIEMIISSGDLLLTVVNDVLDYSKLESGNVDIEIKQSNLQETLNSVVHSIEMKAQSKRITVNTHYGPNVPEYIFTDSRRLQQILYNLLGNAMKFSNECGLVELGLHMVDIPAKAQADEKTKQLKPLDLSLIPMDVFPTHNKTSCVVSPPQSPTSKSLPAVVIANQSKRTYLANNGGKRVDSFCPVLKQIGKKETIYEKCPHSLKKSKDTFCPVMNRHYPAPDNEMEPPPSKPQTTDQASPVWKKAKTVSSLDTTEPSSCSYRRAALDSECVEEQSSVVEVSSKSLFASLCAMGDESKLSTSITTAKPSKAHDECETKRVLRFTVKDYGKGINTSDYERIFLPFQQANAETERVYGGTGLGLAITAKLVYGLGGSISVNSDGCSWSEFTVDLPYSDPDPLPLANLSSIIPKDTLVCVVDKESDDIKRARHVFGQYKVDFCTAGSLENIGSILQGRIEHKKDVIFLIQEDKFDANLYLNVPKPSNSILITFGPRYKIADVTAHYRSLTQLLPSVFMKSLGNHLQNCRSASSAKKHGQKDVLSCYNELRVLVAEDNPINQKIMLRMLHRLGIKRIEMVDNGKKAVELEAKDPFDVVLMDMQMPVMDGVEACKLITQRDPGTNSHARARVIFVTAHVSESFEDKCKAAGSFGFIQKPCNIKSIEKCIHQVFTIIHHGDEL